MYLTHDDFMVDGFSSNQMREIFSPAERLRCWLMVEVAVSTAQGKLGVIPPEAANQILSGISNLTIDEARMAEDYRQVGFPIVPLLNQLMERLDRESAQWVHFGLTTQDVVDTGLVLQMRAGVDNLEKELRAMILALGELASQHRNTVMAGRTFQQLASPTTFGYKTAVWIDELIRHWERLHQLRPRVFVGQLFGAVGTNAAGGPRAPEVQELALGKLGLGVAETSWHSSRDRLAEMVGWLALTCSTLGKIAGEVSMLMRSEVSELREGLAPGGGGSSAMPQKANPVLSPRIIALAQKIQELPASTYRAMMQEHERGVSAMPLEWLTVPDAFLLASGCFSQSRQLVENLTVDVRRMKQNLDLDHGVIMAEAVLTGLATRIDKAEAAVIVAEALEICRKDEVPFVEALALAGASNNHIDDSYLATLCDPHNFLGHAGVMVDAQIEKVNSLFRSDG